MQQPYSPRATNLAAFRGFVVPVVLMVGAVAAAIFIYYRARTNHGGDFGPFALSIALPLLTLGGIWVIQLGLRSMVDRRALANPLRQPRNGSWVAVAGRAIALEEPIEASLSGRPALACSYQVLEEITERTGVGTSSTHSKRLRRCYEGFHQAPTGIETESGTVSLFGLTDLRELEELTLGLNVGRVEGIAEPNPWYLPRPAARARLFAQESSRLRADWKYREVSAGGQIKVHVRLYSVPAT